MSREHINPVQWHQALGIARQVGARIFRDGGSAADALSAFGLNANATAGQDWSRTVEAIAEAICRQQSAQPMRRAA